MSIKQCQKCKKEKDITEFTFKADTTDQLCGLCKICSRASGKQYYEQNKQKEIQRKTFHREIVRLEAQKWILNYFKEHPCSVCGETDPSVLEFDHLRDKEHNISQLLVQGLLEKIKLEVQKCQVLCANDHARKTAVDQSWYTTKTLEDLERKRNETISSLKGLCKKIRRY